MASKVKAKPKTEAKPKSTRTPKYSVDMTKLTAALKKETPVTKIAEQMGLPTEAKPYVFNAIKRLGDKVKKVKPGVYKLA